MVQDDNVEWIENVDDIADRIIQDMKWFMNKHYFPYHMWYVGISEDPRVQVPGVRGECIRLRAPNADIARMVGMHFIEILGTDGNLDNSGEDARYIYAYRKSGHIRP